jgi:hypothetical protein
VKTIELTQWVRPSGAKRTVEQQVSDLAAQCYDIVTKAGYSISIEHMGEMWALFVSDDDIQQDLLTCFFASNETLIKQLESLDVEWLNATRDEIMQAMQEADLHDSDEAAF